MITTTEWGLHPDAESLSRFETVRLLEVNPTTWSDGRRGETLVMPATVQTNSPPGNAKTFRAARRWASSTRVWWSAHIQVSDGGEMSAPRNPKLLGKEREISLTRFGAASLLHFYCTLSEVIGFQWIE